MKTVVFSPLFLALLAAATPLGDRALVQRHHGEPLTRRFLLQSRLDAPAACAALAANITSSPNLTNSTTPLFNSTLPADNSTDTSSNSTTPVDDSTTSDDNSSDSGVHVVSARFNWKALRAHQNRKRIAQQDLPNVAQDWQNLCLTSGGDIFNETDPCVTLAGIGGINALLADADPCDQQDIADAMIDFAKSPGVTNPAQLISNAIAYRKHPRNALNILGVIPSTPYCERAPKNAELAGVVNAQLDGVNPGLFGSPKIAIVPFGTNGTCPFGSTPDISTCTCINGTLPNASGANSTSTNVTDTSNAPFSTDSAAEPSATSDDSTPTSTDDSAPVATDTAADDSNTNTDNTPASTDAAPVPEVTAVVANPPPQSSGPNFQPADISGDVNDING